MNVKCYCQILLLSFLFCTATFAQQNPQPHFRNYTTADGLPSPEVHYIFEDSQGYMWFGTDNGVARFDGYTFKTFGAKEGLMSNVVFDIHEDGKGQIWFGTMTGATYIYNGDTIMPYRYNHLIAALKDQFSAAGLGHLEEDGTAYFELVEYGFLKIDSKGNTQFFRGKLPQSVLVLELKTASKILRTRSNRRDLNNFLAFQDSMYKSKYYHLEFISEDENSTIKIDKAKLIGGARFGIQKIYSRDRMIVMGGDYLHCLKDTHLLWTTPFLTTPSHIIEEVDGSIWFALNYGEGVRRYANLEALKQNKFEQYLSGLSVSRIHKAKDGGIWFSTLEKGIFYCQDLDLITFDTRVGLSNDFVSAVTFKSGKDIIVGCQNGDIFQIDLKKNTTQFLIKNPAGYHNYSLYYLPKNKQLWVGENYYKNKQWFNTKIWHPFLNKFIPQRNFQLRKLHQNTKGEILGCRNTLFCIINPETGLAKLSIDLKIPYQRFFAIHSDTEDQIWLGTSKGLFLYQDSSLIHQGMEHPAFNNRVEDIDQLVDKSFVVGTKGFGVIIWKDQSLIEISTSDGLCSNMLEEVFVDDDNIIWAATLNGLNKITLYPNKKPQVRSFTTHNGLPSNEIYQIKSHQKQLWLCTAGGLVKFKEPKADTLSVPPILQMVKVNTQNSESKKEHTFQHWENNFEFHFLAINYRQDGRIPYRYRIDPDAPWQYTKNLSINYPSLPKGNYAFEVQAQNQDAYWSKSTFYNFQILAPWWSRWWFRTIIVLLGFFLAYRFYKYRINQLQHENDIKAQIINLEKSALQAQMNPHFIFNCLNSIQNFILQNNRKKAVEYLARFAKLVRNNLNASVYSKISLQEEISLLDNYLALERERFGQNFDYQIELTEELKNQLIDFPPMLIQPYVENAVIHGLSKKQGDGFVRIHFTRHQGELLVSIQDNGSGFRKDKKGEKKERHRSLGMSITHKRLELLGTDPAFAVQILSLENNQKEIVGTEVKIRIQIQMSSKNKVLVS